MSYHRCHANTTSCRDNVQGSRVGNSVERTCSVIFHSCTLRYDHGSGLAATNKSRESGSGDRPPLLVPISQSKHTNATVNFWPCGV